VNINDLRDGQRHDIWLPLQNIKMGRLHLAICVLENSQKVLFSFSFSCFILFFQRRIEGLNCFVNKKINSSVGC